MFPLLLIVLWSVTHIYICFSLSVQSVKTNILMVDLYSVKHEDTFWHESPFVFSWILWLHAFFVYFEYIQIFHIQFTLYSCASLSLVTPR